MALQKQLAFRGLNIGSAYAVILNVNTDFEAKRAAVSVGVYANKAAYDAGEKSLFRAAFGFAAMDVPAVIGKAVALRTALYAEIKADLNGWPWANSTDKGGD